MLFHDYSSDLAISSNTMHPSDVDYCLEVRNACLQIHPRLMNLTPGLDSEPGFSVVNYSPEIEL